MHAFKMLPVESLPGHHEPTGVRRIREIFAGCKILGRFIFKEWQWIKCFRSIEEKNVSVPFTNGKTLLPGKSGNLRLCRNPLADTIAIKLPMVKRTSDGFPHHLATGQVCAEMRTARIQHCNLAAGRAECHEVPPKNSPTQRTFQQILCGTKKIPTGRMDRKC